MPGQTLVDRAVDSRSSANPYRNDRPVFDHVAGGDEYDVARHGRLVSASRQVEGLAEERFLQAAEGQERFLWHDGSQGIAFAGMGVAAHLMGYGRSRISDIQRQARELFAHAGSETGTRSE